MSLDDYTPDFIRDGTLLTPDEVPTKHDATWFEEAYAEQVGSNRGVDAERREWRSRPAPKDGSKRKEPGVTEFRRRVVDRWAASR